MAQRSYSCVLGALLYLTVPDQSFAAEESVLIDEILRSRQVAPVAQRFVPGELVVELKDDAVPFVALGDADDVAVAIQHGSRAGTEKQKFVDRVRRISASTKDSKR